MVLSDGRVCLEDLVREEMAKAELARSASSYFGWWKPTPPLPQAFLRVLDGSDNRKDRMFLVSVPAYPHFLARVLLHNSQEREADGSPLALGRGLRAILT